MKPLFTVHAGEFLAGNYIERTFRRVNVWVPAKDTGVDLLVSDAKNKEVLSLQVKFSRDYLVTNMVRALRSSGALGWWNLNCQKIATSPADYWIFVLVGFANRGTDFVIIKPSLLLKRFDAIHGKPKTVRSYLWVTEKRRCWEARGLRRSDQMLIAQGQFKNDERDFTAYLNNWEPIKKLNR